jgi:hypothetical protein
MGLLFAWLLMGIVAGIESHSSKYRQYLRGEKGAKNWYVPCFLLRSVLFALLFEAGISLSLSKALYAVIILETFYLLVLLLKQPYYSALQNFGVFICEFTALYALGLAFVRHFHTPTE